MNPSYVVAIHLLGCVQLFVTPRTAAHWAFLSFTIFWSLLKLKSIELVMPSNHLILCRPLLLPPSIKTFLMEPKSVRLKHFGGACHSSAQN